MNLIYVDSLVEDRSVCLNPLKIALLSRYLVIIADLLDALIQKLVARHPRVLRSADIVVLREADRKDCLRTLNAKGSTALLSFCHLLWVQDCDHRARRNLLHLLSRL